MRARSRGAAGDPTAGPEPAGGRTGEAFGRARSRRRRPAGASKGSRRTGRATRRCGSGGTGRRARSRSRSGFRETARNRRRCRARSPRRPARAVPPGRAGPRAGPSTAARASRGGGAASGMREESASSSHRAEVIVAELVDRPHSPFVLEERPGARLHAADAPDCDARRGWKIRESAGLNGGNGEEKLVVVPTSEGHLDGIVPGETGKGEESGGEGKIFSLDHQADSGCARQPTRVDAEAVGDVDRGGRQSLSRERPTERQPRLRVAIGGEKLGLVERSP